MIEVKCKNNTGRNKIDFIKSDTYYVPVVDGKEHNHVGETEEVALILGLQLKFQGGNSQFAMMACRMLQIDSNWAK